MLSQKPKALDVSENPLKLFLYKGKVWIHSVILSSYIPIDKWTDRDKMKLSAII